MAVAGTGVVADTGAGADIGVVADNVDMKVLEVLPGRESDDEESQKALTALLANLVKHPPSPDFLQLYFDRIVEAPLLNAQYRR